MTTHIPRLAAEELERQALTVPAERVRAPRAHHSSLLVHPTAAERDWVAFERATIDQTRRVSTVEITVGAPPP